mmetsp:Transcript_14047/g.34102  ORF Transcript_14047/g.34102 Transcript_14047/m.34102 type:complete len:224 (+) Transcript_14047:667-1338(+)
MARHGINDAVKLTPRFHIVIDLHEHLHERMIRRAVRNLELSLLGTLERVVHRQQPIVAYHLSDGTSDGLSCALESIFLRRAISDEMAEQELHDSVDGPKQHRSLTENIRNILVAHGCFENEGSTDANTPAKRPLDRHACGVLLHRERAVDPRAINGLALLIQTSHRRSHALRTDCHSVHPIRELLTPVVQNPKQKSVGQTKRRPLLQVLEQLRVGVGLRCVRN